ncbi:MAG TPA: diaminopimelate dehydrogenase [Defluviitaleaceae bacterium]|nr:diaminopimelate dehydrogenase [Candidatus Epulonipiscium sp.]HOQ16197.1 diaminopimelate dehydrogenase [Defluviitaleaceae bacterium]HPT75181.1 diaminopimelate dehydrogenase [Defluviitaleaceae bacterium]HQD51553.1 diaminopimelate dehydrogenase [Defluviitaleaceae bacterium]
MSKIRIGIIGYGNLGKGVELALKKNEDMDLIAVFTRRDPKSVVLQSSQVPVVHIDAIDDYKDKIDVMILCGGSATDLPEQSPKFAKLFNIVDSFDTHSKVEEHFAAVDKAAREGNKVAAISIGWDPGLFSLNRLLGDSILPDGVSYTFWGKGVSQGHSDAIRRIKGVKNAIQYTIPIEEAIEEVRSGSNPELSAGQKHIRECYVVLEENADQTEVEKAIKTMPNYFADYNTIVHFVSEEELKKNHSAMPHGGFVIRSGQTGNGGNKQIIEFSIKLDSNPEFTASVLVAYARAVYRLNQEGQKGAKTIFDIPVAYTSAKSSEELRRAFL